jgi:hypothetical protein
MMSPHEPSDPFASAAHPQSGQFGVDARRSVSAARPLVDLGDSPAQCAVGYLPRRGRPGEEGIEPRPGDAEDPAEPLDAIGVTMIGDESEAADRIVSWAK